MYFSKMLSDNISLIITCKGTKTKNHVQKCSFLHDGNWGDEKLIEHQNFHESMTSDDSYWLGFDSYLSYGKFSGRDGKQQ